MESTALDRRKDLTAHVIVIGGGFAGLATALDLIDRGIRVTVIEARNGLGGRARSFQDPATGDLVDNGQHLFLYDYVHTRRFLNRLGTEQHLVFQDHLKVGFVQPPARFFTLDCPKWKSPWHLLWGMGWLTTLTWRDKLQFYRLAQETQVDGRAKQLDQETVTHWLTRMGQSDQAQKKFWAPLVIATLNENPSTASALGLVQVLRSLLHAPWQNARLGISSVGLTDLYATAAQKEIEKAGGTVWLNRPVAGLELTQNEVTAVRLADGSTLSADAVVSSVPAASLLKLLPPEVTGDPFFHRLKEWKTSPILSINLWFDQNITSMAFVGMIGTRVQWLFNKEAILTGVDGSAHYLSLLISAAREFIDRSNSELVAMALEDLQACFPLARTARLIRSQIVREREATVSLAAGTFCLRPTPETPIRNFRLAGDWIQTGLPATIESAVVSGRLAAQAITQLLRVEDSIRNV